MASKDRRGKTLKATANEEVRFYKNGKGLH